MPAWVLLSDRRREVTVAGIIGFAVALAAASQVAVPIPGTPVPVTLQPLLVVLAGLWLGPSAGAASMVLYLAAGIAGLAVFAPVGPPGMARLLGPTGGYLLAYTAAAAIAGLVSRRMPRLGGRVLASALGILALHIGGVAQLTLLTGDLGRAVWLGSLPFLAPDAVKAVLGGVLSPGLPARGLD